MVAKYLKEYFKSQKISQKLVSIKTGIGRSNLNLSLNNKRKLTAEELVKIAIEFDMDLNQIKRLNNN